jgi:hypothetical protein
MNAEQFLLALGKAFSQHTEEAMKADGAPAWTRYMHARFLEVAASTNAHLCAEGLRELPPAANAAQHISKEYLFDVTVYNRHDWQRSSLPSVIIEHENQWSETALLQDFWKVLVGWAPLRVMIGYAANAEAVDKRVRAILAEAKVCDWRYPQDAEDLVLLRCREGEHGMEWPHWRVLHRCGPGTGAAPWNDLGELTLDGTGLPKSLALATAGD